MKGASIRTAGRLLFGMAWRTPFMERFEVGDASLRRMCKDEREIPPGLARDIEIALRDRANEIDNLLEAITV
jgi:hypothetical protein